MMSIETIHELAREAGVTARRSNKQPYFISDVINEVQAWPPHGIQPFPFPDFGTWCPPGWKVVDEVMVDSTGLDNTGPAMSTHRFSHWLEEGYGYAITETGQFQVRVGKFKPSAAKLKTLRCRIHVTDVNRR